MRFCAGLILLVGVLSVTAGCRKDPYTDAYFDMLNAEKRALEDRIYDLEYDYKQALDELEARRGSEEPQPAPREETLGEPDVSDELDIEIPIPEYPPGFDVSENPASHRTSGNASVVVVSAAASSEDLDRQPTAVRSIRLVAARTGTRDFDGRDGPDGIAILIQPLDWQDKVVQRVGAIDVALLDPTMPEPAARLARWDIDAEMASASFDTTSTEQGIFLRLPWPERPPESDRVHLFVRLETDDGRLLTADQWIGTNPADRVAQTWTPRPADDSSATSRREIPASWDAPLDDADGADPVHGPSWSPSR